MRHLKVPPPHSRIVGPKLQLFMVVLEEIGDAKKLTTEQRYNLTYTMADVIEANQRGLAQLLRKRGDTMPAQQTDPSRLIKPRMKAAVPQPGKETEAAEPAPE
jgi:hypothetical protein